MGEGHSVATTLVAQFHTCWGRTFCRYDIDCSVSHMWGKDILSLQHYLFSFTHVGVGHAVATTLTAQLHTCGGEISCRYNIDCSVSHMWGGICCRYDIDCSVSHMLGVGHSVATTLTTQFHTCGGGTSCRYDISC